MMPDHPGYTDAPRAMEDAIEAALVQETGMIPDLKRSTSTGEAGRAIAEFVTTGMKRVEK